MTSFNLDYFLKILSPNAVTLEVGASMYECSKDTIQPLTVGKH